MKRQLGEFFMTPAKDGGILGQAPKKEEIEKALVYMPESDPRMLSTYDRLKQMFDRAWSLVSSPFERVQIPYEGYVLDVLFYPARGKPGARFPVVYNYAGADGILLRGDEGGVETNQYIQRGMSFIHVDGPGHGGMLRLKKLYSPAASAKAAKAVIDYLIRRPAVDLKR